MIEIRKFSDPSVQMAQLGKCHWSVPRLITLSKDLPVMDVPLEHLNIFYTYHQLTIRDMVMHMNAVNAVDLSYPIIMDEDGDIMDGRHRLMKAILTGASSIKAVRFKENPNPCRRDED